MKRNDLLTNEPFYAKRINQKFARAENRIKFHIRNDTKLRHSIVYINKPLQQNLKILNRLKEGETQKKFHRQFLLGSGYDFNVLTNWIYDEGERFPCLYHYIVKPVGEHTILIKSKSWGLDINFRRNEKGKTDQVKKS